MASFLNYKICDNAPECSGIEVCPVGAIIFNEEKETIEINNEKCISCGMCEQACPIGAFRVAKTEEEALKIQEEIENDPRTTKDLFVDRYGAVAISEFFKIDVHDIEEKGNKECLTLIEVYNPDVAECLFKSIPIKELTKDLPSDTLYYKAESKENIVEYKIKELPSLLLFKKGRLLGKISGYYTNTDKEKIIKEINNIVKTG